MQRHGGKLADVLDGAVPGHGVVNLGNYTQVHAVSAGLLQHLLHDVPFAGRGEKNLVDKLLAGILEERIERTHDIARRQRRARSGTRKIDKALEGVSQMPDAVEMVAQGLRLRSGADNEHVARIQPPVEAPIEKYAKDEPPQAQSDCDQEHRADHNAARDVVGMHQVKRAGEQQA